MSQAILDTLPSHHPPTIYLAMHFLHWSSGKIELTFLGCLWHILRCGTPKKIDVIKHVGQSPH